METLFGILIFVTFSLKGWHFKFLYLITVIDRNFMLIDSYFQNYRNISLQVSKTRKSYVKELLLHKFANRCIGTC